MARNRSLIAKDRQLGFDLVRESQCITGRHDPMRRSGFMTTAQEQAIARVSSRTVGPPLGPVRSSIGSARSASRSNARPARKSRRGVF